MSKAKVAHKELNIPKLIFYGLQHLVVMFGATILVPRITGLSPQVTLFGMGVGTLIFHCFAKGRVPVMLGSSFAFMVGILAITDPVAGPFAGTALTHQDKLAYATGGIVVSGLVYLLLALIVKIVGPDKFMRFLPHAVTGPTVVLIGVILAPFAINQSMTNPILAVLTLAIIIIAMIWGSKMTKTIPILLGLVGAYIIAIIMNALGMTNADGGAVVSFAAVADASIVGLPPFMLPRFNIVAILIMVPFSFATIAEHVADMVILGEAMDEDLVRDKPGLPRTLFGDGVATTIASLFGTPASTTYSENVGLTLLTKVFSSRVVQIGACFAILLGLSPLFAAVVNSIPPAVIGGASIMLYGMIAAVGMKNVKKHVDLNFEKYLIIMAVMLVVGIGMRFGNAIVVNIAGTSVPLDRMNLAVAIVLGVFLNAVLPNKKKTEETDKDAG